MKLASILVLCLAITAQQTRANPLIFEAISEGARTAGSIAQGVADTAGQVATGAIDTANGIAQGAANAASGIAKGAIGAATGISKGAIGVGTGIVSTIGDKAAAAAKSIGEKVTEIRNKALQRAMQQAQTVLKNIQDATRGALQASQIAGKSAQEAIAKLEEKQNENFESWADQARNKLANSSDEAQIKGQDLIDGLSEQSSKNLKKCTVKIVEQLQKLQDKANSTAERYHEPMNNLIKKVGSCSQIKANDYKGLAACGAKIREALGPLAGAPIQLAAVKAEIIKSAIENAKKNICAGVVLNKFRKDASSVDQQIDELVAEDSKKAESDDVEEPDTAPAEDSETAPAEDSETAPAEDSKTAPAEDSETAPAEDSKTAPAEDSETAPAEDSKTAPAEDSETAPAEDSKTAPAEDSEK